MEKFFRAWDNKNSCVVHVRDLPKETRNGKKCDCRCVDCEGPLEALQGDINDWSFRHQSNTTCKGGPMTALHILAQELLTEDNTIKIRGGEVSYSNATKEWPIPCSSFKADVSGTKGDDTRFLIEVFVKHKLEEDDDKVRHIRENKFHAIEIDLSKVDPDISKEDLLNLLLNDISKQRVIYSPSDIEVKPPEIVSVDSGPSFLQVLLVSGAIVWFFNWVSSFFKDRNR